MFSRKRTRLVSLLQQARSLVSSVAELSPLTMPPYTRLTVLADSAISMAYKPASNLTTTESSNVKTALDFHMNSDSINDSDPSDNPPSRRLAEAIDYLGKLSERVQNTRSRVLVTGDLVQPIL